MDKKQVDEELARLRSSEITFQEKLAIAAIAAVFALLSLGMYLLVLEGVYS